MIRGFIQLAAAPTALKPDDALAGVTTDIVDLPKQTEELTREFIHWVRADSLQLLAGVGLSLLFYGLMVTARGWARRRLGHHHNSGAWSWIMLKIAARTRSYFLITLAFFVMTRLIGAPPAWHALITVLFTIGAVVQGAFWVRELLVSLMERRLKLSGDDPAISSALGIVTILINVVVWAIAGIILLDNLGVNVTALVAGLGIGGIAIGLAAQGIFSDLFAALAILMDQPFRKGESIQVGDATGISGTVEHIGMKTTRIRAQSGEMVVMSNANLLNRQIHNFTACNSRQVIMRLRVIYQTDPQKLESIPAELEKIVGQTAHCLFTRASFAGFDPSGVDFELVFQVLQPDALSMFRARQLVAFAILRRFQALGIVFAYPAQISFLGDADGRIVQPSPAQPAPTGHPAASAGTSPSALSAEATDAVDDGSG